MFLLYAIIYYVRIKILLLLLLDRALTRGYTRSLLDPENVYNRLDVRLMGIRRLFKRDLLIKGHRLIFLFEKVSFPDRSCHLLWDKC